jgi:hypothetical protein
MTDIEFLRKLEALLEEHAKSQADTTDPEATTDEESEMESDNEAESALRHRADGVQKEEL